MTCLFLRCFPPLQDSHYFSDSEHHLTGGYTSLFGGSHGQRHRHRTGSAASIDALRQQLAIAARPIENGQQFLDFNPAGRDTYFA